MIKLTTSVRLTCWTVLMALPIPPIFPSVYSNVIEYYLILYSSNLWEKKENNEKILVNEQVRNNEDDK